MYLSLVRNSLFILFLFIPYGFCEETAIGEAYYSRDISENECYDLAKMEAEKKIMSNAGLSHASFLTKDICSDTNEDSDCKLFQDSEVYYDGGFISDKSFFDKKILGKGINRVCNVTIKANVTYYASQPDPSFMLRAELEKELLIENEKIKILGKMIRLITD